MSKEDGYGDAVRLAVEKLRQVDMAARCAALGLGQPQVDGLSLRAFGLDLELRFSDFQLFRKGSDVPFKVFDRILILHYLLYDRPVVFSGQLISFRDFTAGPFYWKPFCTRSVRPLEKRFGNNIQQLQQNLNRFDWVPVAIGDLGARIHVIGNLYVTLIYRLGDDELPPAADLLFDAAIKPIYNAEDAAVLGSRICLGLL